MTFKEDPNLEALCGADKLGKTTRVFVNKARKHAADRQWKLAVGACRTALVHAPDSVEAQQLLAIVEEKAAQEEAKWQEANRPPRENPVAKWLVRVLIAIVIVIAGFGTAYRFLLDFIV